MAFQPADYTALKAARDACIASGGGYTTNDFTGCQSANNVPIANWDVSLVDDMHNLFIGTTSGNEIFNPDLSKWVTGAVTDMRSMFDGQTAFNSDISGCKCLMLFAVDHTSSKRCTHTQLCSSFSLLDVEWKLCAHTTNDMQISQLTPQLTQWFDFKKIFI